MSTTAQPAPTSSGDERRESPRIPMRLLVRDVSLGGSFEARDGNFSLGGFYYREAHPPQGSHVEVRFVLPGSREEIQALGEVLRVDRTGDGFGVHLRFAGLTLEQERVIARFLDRR